MKKNYKIGSDLFYVHTYDDAEAEIQKCVIYSIEEMKTTLLNDVKISKKYYLRDLDGKYFSCENEQGLKDQFFTDINKAKQKALFMNQEKVLKDEFRAIEKINEFLNENKGLLFKLGYTFYK